MRRLPAVLLLVAAPLLAEDPWYADYQRGLDALQRGDSASAVSYFQSAVQKRPESSVRAKTYGMVYIQYFPYFYMGKAYYLGGRYSDALNAFATEERYGEINRVSLAFQEMRDLRQQANDRLKRPPDRKPPTGDQPGTSSQGPTRTGPQEVTAVERADVKRRNLLFVANALLDQQKYEEAIVEFEKVFAIFPGDPEATAGIEKARKVLDERRMAEQRRAISRLLSGVPQAFAAGNYRAVRDAANAVLAIDPAHREAAQWLRKVEEVERAATMEKMNLRDLVRSGLANYFDGRYREAVVSLEAALARDRLNATCRFFLGCSYAAIYLVSGEEDREALSNAEQEFRQLAQSSPTFRIDSSYISPQILEIYRRVTGLP
ncbi:MAG: tetratricopeptide repeat protein [Acidobacteriota bacterium]